MDNIKEVLDGIEKKLETKAANDAKQAAEAALAEVKTQLKAAEEKAVTAEKEVTELKNWKVTKEEADKKNQEFLDKIAEERKSKPFTGNRHSEVKTFNEILAETIERNVDAIQGFKSGMDIRFDMMPELKKEAGKEREVKAVGDMSIGANFSGATVLYQDIRPLIQSPYNRVWLSDILTPGNSTGTQLVYPKENGGEGSPEVWESSMGNKAQFDFDLTSATSPFKWIAGYVIIEREMLDDIAWLTSYLQNKMLISLKTRENAFVLNGWTTGSQQVVGLLAAATQYDNVNSYTNQVQIIVDAGWGQIVEDTQDFYQPTHTILNPRTAVAIGLNQASGSGEFDLPNGSVAFANGKLQIAGMDNVTTTSLDPGEFLVLDRAAASFVRRMQPELRMFEDSILAKANKIMFRIEERATLAIFNNAAIVKGTTAGAGSF